MSYINNNKRSLIKNRGILKEENDMELEQHHTQKRYCTKSQSKRIQILFCILLTVEEEEDENSDRLCCHVTENIIVWIYSLLFLRHGLIMWLRLASDSWQSPYLSLLSPGILGVWHPHLAVWLYWLSFVNFETGFHGRWIENWKNKVLKDNYEF